MIKYIMLTIGEIIEDIKDNKQVTYEELRYALLALDFLGYQDHKDLLKIGLEKEKSKFLTPEWYANESFRRRKTAFAQDAKVYVGWNNDPANPEYQKRRKIAFKLIDKVLAEKAANGCGDK